MKCKYSIPNGSKIVCCVGSIGKRKNQKQVISAFEKMPVEMKEKTYILFVGSEDPSYCFTESVEQSEWHAHFVRCGLVNKNDVSELYKSCDGVMMVSLSEGFGLSLIEGMNYGKPCLAIENMDAFEDIYSPCAMIGVKEHDDQLIADGMVNLLTRKWNSEAIKQHSRIFTNEYMTRNYMRVLVC